MFGLFAVSVQQDTRQDTKTKTGTFPFYYIHCKLLVIPAIWLALNNVIYSWIVIFFALSYVCSKSHIFLYHFCFDYKMKCKSHSKTGYEINKILVLTELYDFKMRHREWQHSCNKGLTAGDCSNEDIVARGFVQRQNLILIQDYDFFKTSVHYLLNTFYPQCCSCLILRLSKPRDISTSQRLAR